MSRKSYDEEAGQAHTRWNIGTSAAASGSFEIEAWAYSKFGDYALQVMQKVEPTMTHNLIPSTQESVRCYMRSMIDQGGKIDQFRKADMDFKMSIWRYLTMFLSMFISTNYRIYFYSLYCPDEHFVTAGMVPVVYGLIFLHLINFFMELWTNSELIVLLLDYSLRGLFDKIPWYRCKLRESYTSAVKINPICLPLQNFSNLLKEEKDFIYDGNNYVDKKGVFYTTPVLHHYNKRYTAIIEDTMINTEYWTHCLFIWIVAAAFYTVILKKRFWKIYQYVHIAYNGIRYAAFLFILWNSSIFVSLSKMIEVKMEKNDFRAKRDSYHKYFDQTFLTSATIITPPVLHLLLARNPKHTSHPELDSMLLSISSILYILVNTVLMALLRTYCQSVYNYTIHVRYSNTYQALALYPIFFSTLFMKDLISLVYFVTYFLNEFLTFVITFQCMVEIISSEWKIIPRYAATIAIFIIGCIGNMITTPLKRVSLHVYIRGLTSVIETFAIYWFYPLDRMFDDETFQFGKPPTLLKKILTRAVPYYLFYKYFYAAWAWYNIALLYKEEMGPTYGDRTWLYLLIVFGAIVSGATFMGIKLMYRQRQSWKSLFRPRPNFGPRDHVTRQLRKQFDAREYVGSQSSRYLSRHIMAKAGPQTYRLDVRYDTAGRRSTVIGTLSNIK